MHFIKFLLLFTLSCLPLMAKQTYKQLIITKTSHKENLASINQQLQRVNIKMYVEQKESYYVIYSQKFTSEVAAQKALQRAKRVFPYARVLERKINISTKKSTTKRDKNIFLNIAGGYASSSSSAGRTSGASYLLEGGYYFTKNIFTSIAYLNSATSDINMQSIYASLNYKYYFTKNFACYGGVLGGYGTLELVNPKSSASSSFIFGGQIGLSYDVLEYLSLYTTFQGMVFEHIIEFPAENVKVDTTLNPQIGVSFRF